MRQQLHIRTFDKSYLQAQNGGGGVIDATGPWPREFETFTLFSVDNNVTAIHNGDKVRLRSHDGHFVAVSDSQGTLKAIVPSVVVRPRPRGGLPIHLPPGSTHWPPDDWSLPRDIKPDIFTLVIADGEGNTLNSLSHFGLRAANGKYVCAENGGGGTLAATRSSMAEWETFTAEFHPEPTDALIKLNLRTSDGFHFLQAKNGGGGEITAQGPWPREWETFDLLAANHESMGFPANAQVNLRAQSGHYVQAKDGGGSTVSASAPSAREFETFTLVLPRGIAKFQQGCSFGLRTHNGHYLTAVGGGGSSVMANANEFGLLETFEFTNEIKPLDEPQGNQGRLQSSIREKPQPETRTEGTSKEESPQADFVCQTRPVTITTSFNDALLLNPLSDVVWPGSLVDGSRWVNGEYCAVTDPRASMTLSMSLPVAHEILSSQTVQNPTNSSVRTALNELRSRFLGQGLSANIQSETKVIHSREQLQIALSGSFDTGVYRLASKFDFDSNTVLNKILFKYQQIYYTVDVDLPSSGADFFVSKRAPEPNEMLISSVSYGRMLLLAIESSESVADVKAAVEFAYKPYSVDAKTSAHYNKTLSGSTKNVLILGGPAGLAEKVVMGGLNEVMQEIKNFITISNVYSQQIGEIPLSYRMRFLQKGFPIGNICLTTTYTERQCVKSTGRVRVKNIRIACIKESDPGSEIELYGKIWVRGGVDGGGTVLQSEASDLIWDRNSDNYVPLPELKGDADPDTKLYFVSREPTFTFKDLPSIQDRAFVEVSADFWEEDDFSGDDHITGDSKKFYLNELPSSGDGGTPSDYKMRFVGDDNIVEIWFNLAFM